MDTSLSARQRAVTAHAELVKERRAKDRRVVKATTAYFRAQEKVATAQERVAAAEQERDLQVQRLLDEGLGADDVAVLLSLPDAKSVASAARRYRAQMPENGSADARSETSGDGVSAETAQGGEAL